MTRTAETRLVLRKAPRQERAEQTVAILIEAAAQVLESAGLEGYNTNAVARRAGVSIGSLYQYFPSKDALTVALMHREDARFHKDVVQALRQSNGHDAMRSLINAAVRQQLARPRLARLLDIEEGRPELQRALKDTRSFGALLGGVLKSSDLPPQRRPRVATADLGAIIRGLTDAAGERGETNLADLGRRISAAVFGYLDAMSASPPAKKASSSGRKRERSS